MVSFLSLLTLIFSILRQNVLKMTQWRHEWKLQEQEKSYVDCAKGSISPPNAPTKTPLVALSKRVSISPWGFILCLSYLNSRWRTWDRPRHCCTSSVIRWKVHSTFNARRCWSRSWRIDARYWQPGGSPNLARNQHFWGYTGEWSPRTFRRVWTSRKSICW